jgi:hypothetical protein
MPYLGNTPTTQSFISGTDYFNGTGSQTAFTLSRTVASINDIQVTVNNVVQQPNDAYTISGTTLTMTSAPSSGTNNVYVRYLSTTTQAITPSQGTVSWSTLDSNVQGDLGISFKNRIINSNMAIDQRNAGASITPSNTGGFMTDRWVYYASQASKFTAQQVTTAPAGFTNSLKMTVASAVTVGASDYFLPQQFIEGFNVGDLGWGTANAKTVTLSFQVYSSLTGTFGGSLRNEGDNRCYPFTYTISSANTWTPISITIAGDTSGGWNVTNGIGIKVCFSLGAGSTVSGTAGAWATGPFYSATGAVSVVGTAGATWYITGVQLEVGTQATTFTTAGGSYGAELALCQRYYEVAGQGIVGIPNSTTGIYALVNFKVTKRTTPSVSLAITNPTCIQWGISNRTASGATVASTYMNAVGGSIRVEGFSSVTTGSSGGFVDDNTFQFSAEL